MGLVNVRDDLDQEGDRLVDCRVEDVHDLVRQSPVRTSWILARFKWKKTGYCAHTRTNGMDY